MSTTTAARPATPTASPPGHDIAERIHGFLCAALLLAGLGAFSWGGSQHPPTDTSLGEIGTPEYFTAFVHHVLHDGNWRVAHAALLAGPVLWALGTLAFARLDRRPGAHTAFGSTATLAMGMGAMLWAVTFVIDGFVAPRQAAAVAAADYSAESLESFASFQEVVARLGLVSWLLIGTGIAATAVTVLLSRNLGVASRLIVGVSGLVIGLWPVLGWAIGEFRPSVFTSPLWTTTALLTTLWFALAAIALAWWNLRRTDHP